MVVLLLGVSAEVVVLLLGVSAEVVVLLVARVTDPSGAAFTAVSVEVLVETFVLVGADGVQPTRQKSETKAKLVIAFFMDQNTY